MSPPPQASINPTLPRRRSDYVDQSEEALSAIGSRPSIDYPELTRHVIRPPPPAASPPLERQNSRHRPHASSASRSVPLPPMIKSDYPVSYWSDLQISTIGLKNLGNTCYMNATIQCLSATVPFARFFTGGCTLMCICVVTNDRLGVDGRWKTAVNMMNPLGTKGGLAQGFANILHELWHGEIPYLAPYSFRVSGLLTSIVKGGINQILRKRSATMRLSSEAQTNMTRKSFSFFYLTVCTRI